MNRLNQISNRIKAACNAFLDGKPIKEISEYFTIINGTPYSLSSICLGTAYRDGMRFYIPLSKLKKLTPHAPKKPTRLERLVATLPSIDEIKGNPITRFKNGILFTFSDLGVTASKIQKNGARIDFTDKDCNVEKAFRGLWEKLPKPGRGKGYKLNKNGGSDITH